MKKILFFLFLSLSAFLNANEKNNKLADLLHSFGDNGEYAQMDSVYNLIIHEDHYKQDKLYALNITLDYARFLNQKGDSERANTLLTQIRESAMALEKFPENTMYLRNTKRRSRRQPDPGHSYRTVSAHSIFPYGDLRSHRRRICFPKTHHRPDSTVRTGNGYPSVRIDVCVIPR